MNNGFGGLTEADFAYATAEIVKVANAVCGGRVISVLEGGYNVQAAARRRWLCRYRRTWRRCVGATTRRASRRSGKWRWVWCVGVRHRARRRRRVWLPARALP